MNTLARIRDFGFLRGASLVAACALSAHAEYALAAAIGIPGFLPAAFPIAVDALMLAALQHRQFVAAATLLMAALNVASHLLVSPVHSLPRWVVAAVSVVPVFVVFLIERMSPREAAVRPAESLTAPLPTEETGEAENGPQTAEEPAPVPAARPDADDGPDPLLPDARELDANARSRTGRGASLRELQRELRIGQKRAQRIRDQLALTA
ncbi:hypothetical protein [Streptomyces cinereoruber]|uniref:hypothetical protein n=1 Tax=Streptomyces cinereoruber TaxID=67260 RepID=UPI003626BA19